MKRRQFLKTTAFAGAAGLILPEVKLFGAEAPSNKLNVALIGTWGRGEAHFSALSKENIVALCDVNEEHLAYGAKKLGCADAKQYVDWRKLLDQKDVEAVVCCTADHMHAFVANWAMNRGKHIYCEKPLANSVEEARVVRANYLKNKNKLATQVGTQRHEYDNFNRLRELVLDGAIGELKEVSAWGDRQLRKPGYLPAAGDPPKTSTGICGWALLLPIPGTGNTFRAVWHDLLAVEVDLGLRQWPGGGYGQPHHGPRLECH